MSRRKRRRGRHESDRREKHAQDTQQTEATSSTQATARKKRRTIVSWRARAREVLRRLREFAREAQEPAIEEHLRAVFGDTAQDTDVADLERAFDDFVCQAGSAGDGRSLVRAFAEDAPDLEDEERKGLPAWEKERTRRVYLLDRCHRDQMELWDPLRGGRIALQLLDRMPAARAAALTRGTVVTATAAPFGKRQVALGRVEIYDDDEAVAMYRREVRSQGRLWHDLPPAVPS